MFRDVELSLVPSAVVGGLLLIWLTSIALDVGTAIGQPPPCIARWGQDGSGNAYRITPRDPVWEPLLRDG
jgi:hypothetical protein